MVDVVLVFDAGCLIQDGLVQGEMGAFIVKVVGPLEKHIYVDDKDKSEIQKIIYM